MHEDDRRSPIRIRTEGTEIVVTLDPRQAHELAALIARSTPGPDWLQKAASALAETAERLEPARRPGQRRPLRLPGLDSVPRTTAVRARERPVIPELPQPRRGVGARRATRLNPSPATAPRAEAVKPRPAGSGSGLAAAVAVFAEAISVGDESKPANAPAPVPARSLTTAEERARHLQEILDAAARTSHDAAAEV
jgi:hypothetical protein